MERLSAVSRVALTGAIQTRRLSLRRRKSTAQTRCEFFGVKLAHEVAHARDPGAIEGEDHVAGHQPGLAAGPSA